MSPTWYFLKLGPAGIVCAWAAPMKASGLSRPKAANAPAAPTTKSRRETWNMGIPSVRATGFEQNGAPAAPAPPAAEETNPGAGARHRRRRAIHGFVMTGRL